MRTKRPTRKQKKIISQIYHMNPGDWLVARWLPESDIVELVNKHTGIRIRRMKPETV
ncbi:MAG: DUF6906 family protein [Ruminococcus sp.]